METNIDFPEEVLSSQLKDYFSNKFMINKNKFDPYPDTEFWRKYIENDNSTNNIPFKKLRECYPQLNFPIEEDIEKNPSYRDATLKGMFIQSDFALKLNNESEINVKIFKNIAYDIPVITVPDGSDFETLIQSLIYKNNPVNIPKSMGATLISGINNWKKLNDLKQKWTEKNSSASWNEEFSNNILPNTYLYKDKIILLSTKPYSNVDAEKLNLNNDEWQKISLNIRLEHECVHLYTLKKYGSATNNLHDELVADYIGIITSAGNYQKKWMLTFMGLENFPEYRKGARLENYLSGMNLSENEFIRLTEIIKNAIENIAEFDAQVGILRSERDKKLRIEVLCETDLLQISSSTGTHLLLEKYGEKSAH
ncbi:DUF7005 family protein [Chryseobacterium sp. MMS23-Vi53]|uniref:DUF7005 family protein n=1 Tax=Chryseobacterium sp. MMS23-Vi53 TaxID=3386644 RepID=UPI0039E805A8